MSFESFAQVVVSRALVTDTGCEDQRPRQSLQCRKEIVFDRCADYGADWPNFRGPNFDGISRETGLISTSERPLKLLWEREVGSAFSSFAAVEDCVYTCGMGDGQQILYCLKADTGEVLWQKPFEKEFRNEHGDGTRATPTSCASTSTASSARTRRPGGAQSAGSADAHG